MGQTASIINTSTGEPANLQLQDKYPFQETCHSLSYDADTGILSGTCKNATGGESQSVLNLNDCLCRTTYGDIALYQGPYFSGVDAWPVINMDDGKTKQTISFEGYRLTCRLEGESWGGGSGVKVSEFDLLPHLSNSIGIVNFKAKDKEYSQMTKNIMWLLNALPNPGLGRGQPIFSLAIEKAAAKQENRMRAEDQQVWLKRTWVGGEDRFVRGYSTIREMKDANWEIDIEHDDWRKENDPHYWDGYEPK